jgi:hypothetical protein
VRAVRWTLGLTLAVFPFGCLGGQTGQPTVDTGSGGTCNAPTVDVPVDRPIRRVVPLDAALSLEGSIVEPLFWFDALGEPLPPGVLDDEITLTFTYDGGPAAYDPCASGGPKIEMVLDVTTRDTSRLGGGTVWVSFFPPKAGPEPFAPDGTFASFGSLAGTLPISGRLIQTASGTRAHGIVIPETPPVPGAHGEFGPPPAVP